mgnify:FL=1
MVRTLPLKNTKRLHTLGYDLLWRKRLHTLNTELVVAQVEVELAIYMLIEAQANITEMPTFMFEDMEWD